MVFLKIKSWFLKTFICCSLVLSSCSTNNRNLDQPNIIFILADDLGWADLPCYGNAFHEAPNLTRLREQGMLFTQAYAANPVCSPTRASIQTGKYPARLGINDFIPGHWRPFEELTVPINRTQYLPTEEITIAELLKEAGYQTGFFGKWHLGWGEEHQPGNQGYDEWRIHRRGAYTNLKTRKAIYPEDATLTDEQRVSEVLTDYATDFMNRNQNQPYFLFLSHWDVHVQLHADSALIQKYLQKDKPAGYPGNAVYAAMIEHLDHSVGRVMDMVEELGQKENTMIIFFSDNGGLVHRFDEIPLINEELQYLYEDDTLLYTATSNSPLRGEKGSVYEGGIREPLLVSWPGRISAGSTSEQLVSSIDFLPTIGKLVKQELPKDVDGIDLTPVLLSDQDTINRNLYWHYPVYHHDVPASAVRNNEWKLIQRFSGQPAELYNLAKDLSEDNNMAEIQKEQYRELHTLLQEWHRSLAADMPTKNPNFNESRRKEWSRHPSVD